jgi:hypothetical protein
MAVHSKLFSPSAAKRRIACPGSARFEAKFPNKSSVYAAEGSAAHALAEKCLINKQRAEVYLGYWVAGDLVVSKLDNLKEEEKKAAFSVDLGMVEAVQVYLDFCNSLPKGIAGIERRVKVNEDVYGTADYIKAIPYGPVYVVDYKHGVGVAVSPEENPQAMIYALGALMESEYEHSDVHITIVQPRARKGNPINTWTISADALYAWAKDVLYPAVEACKDPNAPLSAGDHCQFCRAAGECSQPMEQALQITKAAPGNDGYVIHRPDELTIEEQDKAFCFFRDLELYKKALERHMNAQAEKGVEYPSLKLVAKNTKRKWNDQKEVVGAFHGIIGDELYKEPQLQTPLQVENALKDAGYKPAAAKELVASYCHKPEGAPVLVHKSDKRKAIAPTATRVFDALPDFG